MHGNFFIFMVPLPLWIIKWRKIGFLRQKLSPNKLPTHWCLLSCLPKHIFHWLFKIRSLGSTELFTRNYKFAHQSNKVVIEYSCEELMSDPDISAIPDSRMSLKCYICQNAIGCIQVRFYALYANIIIGIHWNIFDWTLLFS